MVKSSQDVKSSWCSKISCLNHLCEIDVLRKYCQSFKTYHLLPGSNTPYEEDNRQKIARFVFSKLYWLHKYCLISGLFTGLFCFRTLGYEKREMCTQLDIKMTVIHLTVYVFMPMAVSVWFLKEERRQKQLYYKYDTWMTPEFDIRHHLIYFEIFAHAIFTFI